MAGCFAAIKAREQGASVVLVDKGYVSRSGETPYAGDTTVFNPAWGHDLEQWLTQASVVGEYLNNRHWNEVVFRDSYARFEDMRSWGVGFLEKDGEAAHLPHPYTQAGLPDSNKFPPLVSEVVHLLPGFPEIIRKQVVRSGAKIVDRFMVTELLRQDGRVIGALGFHLEDNELRVIRAKCTVVCAGGGGFRPVGYPTHELTADGHVMAYEAGAVITGKEFVWSHRENPDHPAWPPVYLRFSKGMKTAMPGGRPKRTLTNAEGEEVPMRGVAWHGWIDAEYEAHEGRAPLYLEVAGKGRSPVGGPGNHGSMLGHAAGGICPVDDDCATHVPGLYAAGDSCGTCFVGAAYSGFGFATMHAAVTGARSGEAAARQARELDAAMPDERLLAEARRCITSWTIPTNNPLFRRKACVQIGFWDERMKCYEDASYMAGIFCKGLNLCYVAGANSYIRGHRSTSCDNHGPRVSFRGERDRAYDNVLALYWHHEYVWREFPPEFRERTNYSAAIAKECFRVARHLFQVGGNRTC